MVEIELKFQLAQSKKRAVLQRLKRAKAQVIHLQAKYYDTPDQLLAKHGIAIRLRQEGEEWVQTFKAADTSNSKHGHLQRIEEEIHLGVCEQEPELDLSLYQDSKPVQRILDKVLKSSSEALQLQFKTDVQRYFYVQQLEDTSVEICLDDGEIISGESKTPIFEMEFELKEGSIEQLIVAAKGWVSQYGLWLDVRSKAERGHLLATHQAVSPAPRAKKLSLDADLSSEQVLQHIVGNCLEQLLPNSAAIAAGVANPEHIHQARIAIRRLRSALKHFGKWSAHLNLEWQTQLTALFRQLGTTRDVDVITSEVLPKLTDIGAPDLTPTLSTEHEQDTTSLFTQADTVNLLLDLLNFSTASYTVSLEKQSSEKQSSKKSSSKKELTQQQDAKKHPVKTKIAKSLERLHHQVIRDADQFSKLDIEARHDMRKRVKQLRYLIEFIGSLYPEKQVKSYLKHLQPVQDRLGEYNDMIIAQEFFQQQLEHNPHFLFALGWSQAQQEHLLIDASHALEDFAPTKTFW